MKVGIIGSGHIGANIGRRAAEAGHDVRFSFAHDEHDLEALAKSVGRGARASSPSEAAASDVVVLAVPWTAIDTALADARTLAGRVVVDATNPYGQGGLVAVEGEPTGAFNARRLSGAKVVKAFNTLTAAFQEAARAHPGSTAMFFAGDDDDAKATAAELIRAVGFEPVDLGRIARSDLLDAPRRPGGVYGEAFTPDDAREIARAWIAGDAAEARRLAAERAQA